MGALAVKQIARSAAELKGDYTRALQTERDAQAEFDAAEADHNEVLIRYDDEAERERTRRVRDAARVRLDDAECAAELLKERVAKAEADEAAAAKLAAWDEVGDNLCPRRIAGLKKLDKAIDEFAAIFSSVATIDRQIETTISREARAGFPIAFGERYLATAVLARMRRKCNHFSPDFLDPPPNGPPLAETGAEVVRAILQRRPKGD